MKKEYPFLKKPVEITAQKWPDETATLVSICCIAYKHEPYIRDAIDGFLMQKTTFRVEILIHDDASPDRTADIIASYEKKYPHLFKPVYQTENQFSKGVKPGRETRERAHGAYIAICDGDDYWTDPQKIQKQVDFLESNKAYVLVYHPWVEFFNGKISEPRRVFPSTHTLLFRNIRLNYPPEVKSVLNGDDILLFLLKQHGKFAYLDDIKPAVKRRDSGGIWNSLNRLEKAKAKEDTYSKLLTAFANTEYEQECKKLYEYRLRKLYNAANKDGVSLSHIDFYKTIFKRGLILTYLRSLLRRVVKKKGIIRR